MANLHFFQKGFNYSQDGPGNRLVYHLQGCNMRCPWCANPEGLKIETQNNLVQSVECITEEILNSRKMFFDGGGVTLSGGEVTCQLESAFLLLEKLHQQQISTCIETNGTHPQLQRILPFVDYLIIDLKHYDNEKHKKYTGISNTGIKENLRKIAEQHRQVLIRTPLIHKFNDSITDTKGFLDFYKEIGMTDGEFEFLAYHEYGKDKWLEQGLDYKMTDGFITSETKEYFESKFQANGYRVIRT